jgi:hypothetical protein
LPISRCFTGLEPEVLDGLLDALLDLLVAVVGRQAELRAVRDRLLHRELGVHDVVLRHVPDAAAERVVDGVEVLAVDPHLARGGAEVAVEHRQQGGLARARRAHQRDEVARQGLEGHVVEEDLVVPGSSGRAPRGG